MPGTDHGPSIKNPRVYEALRRKGMSKERAARISNAARYKGLSATAPLVVSPSGPGGLLSTAGLGSVASRRRKLKARRKAFDESKVTRDDTGKFSGSGGGGGGGASAPPKKPAKAPKQTPEQRAAEAEAKKQANIDAAFEASDLSEDSFYGLMDFAKGGEVDGEKELEAKGLIEKGGDGQYRMTSAGRAFVSAAERGDTRAARDAASRGADQVTKRQATEAKRAETAKKREERKAQIEARRQEREQAKQKKQAEAEAKKKKGGGGGGGKKEPEQPVARVALPALNLYQTLGLGRAGKSFAVTKGADGRHRWILRTTTAFRDRDGEILSEAALDRDSQRMMTTRQLGPLRYWHMGAPDPANVAAPWGPGVDLGTCDYSQVVGRTRIESGTFYDERVGAAFQRAADQYEASPGFFHTPDQPRQGVFTDIQTFERSVVPVRLARASNYFTGMATTKERSTMTPEEFKRRAKAFLDDMAALGVSPDAAQGVLAAAQTAEKSAQRQGIAYKEAGQGQPVYALPDGTPAIIVGGQLVALKALPMPPAEMVEAGTTEVVDGAAEEAAEAAEGDDEGPILGPADAALIAEAVVTALMSKMGDMQAQLNAFEEELKARGYARMKEAADQLGPKLDQLTRVLAQYVDDLPAAGHRASQDASTVVRADDPTAAQGALNVGAKSHAAPPATPEEAILRWVAANNGGVLPWDVPARASLPDGVNPAQHQAPGTR